jgi:hypothetical protein
LRTVLHLKILITSQIEIALIAFADGKYKPDLRTDADRLPFERSKLGAGAAVAGELLEEIAGDPDLDALADDLRRNPIEAKSIRFWMLAIQPKWRAGSRPSRAPRSPSARSRTCTRTQR